ncbi:MAG TPA: C2H2-type zinc finger protein [Clostridia bacterium]|nr:C2H2-type zinc finger protein [Clostridia bacterium]HOR12446.1 C2H2-type zinc finger protein [Clostridia bacterium]
MGFSKYREDLEEALFESKKSLDPNHDNMDISKEPPKFVCDYCKACFDSQEALNNHLRQVHNRPVTTYANELTKAAERAPQEPALPSIRKNQEAFIEAFLDEINKEVTSQSRPDLDKKAKFEEENALNIDERNYLSAIFNYYFACRTAPNNKDSLYEKAYAELLPFKNQPRALLALKVICLRNLHIDRLRDLCNNTTHCAFSLVCDFFSGKTAPSCISEDSDSAFYLYIEDEEYQFIQGVIRFIKGEYNAVEHYLGKTIPLLEGGLVNPVMKDKVSFLKSRLCSVKGNTAQASDYLKKIKNKSIINKLETI